MSEYTITSVTHVTGKVALVEVHCCGYYISAEEKADSVHSESSFLGGNVGKSTKLVT
jgi:hypothetical protein